MRGGHIETVKLLLEHGADISLQTDDLSSVLHHCVCGEGEAPALLKLLKYLHESGKTKSMMDATNEDSFTPLHMAACYGKLDMVKYLVEVAGADVHKGSDEGDVLELAAEFPEVVAYLKTKVTASEIKKPEAETVRITEKFGYGAFDGEEAPQH